MVDFLFENAQGFFLSIVTNLEFFLFNPLFFSELEASGRVFALPRISKIERTSKQ
jgi:hypothetical protein